MTNAEKERFCLLAASLLAPPDEGFLADLRQEGLRSLLGAYARQWGADERLAEGLVQGGNSSLPVLREEYSRLFGAWQEKISLVESTYKPWTGDRQCGMVFAASKGLVMGDPALHMRELYRQSSLEVPEEYRSMPDHLCLEMEFLALLYRWAAPEQIARFIADHLDWIAEFEESVGKAAAHPFYRSAVELLHLFLRCETRNGKVTDHGQKTIH